MLRLRPGSGFHPEKLQNLRNYILPKTMIAEVGTVHRVRNIADLQIFGFSHPSFPLALESKEKFISKNLGFYQGFFC